MIEFKNISKSYKGNKVFNNFSYSFPKEGIFHLIGKNGSGKSTMLKLISGLTKQQKGRVIYSDKQFKQKTSFLFHEPLYVEGMSILDNIKIHFFLTSIKNYDMDYFEHLASILDIPLKDKIEGFSEGMKKKASLLISISHKPIYCIWDEPLSGLDNQSIEIIKSEVIPKLKWGIITSHIIDLPATKLNLDNIKNNFIK